MKKALFKKIALVLGCAGVWLVPCRGENTFLPDNSDKTELSAVGQTESAVMHMNDGGGKLTVTPAALSLQLNEEKVVVINGGAAGYCVSEIKAITDMTGADKDLAGYILDGNRLTIKGRLPGNIDVVITDGAGAKTILNLRVNATLEKGFVLIPFGSFMMGSEDGDDREKPVHRITLPETYAKGTTEVTNAQFCTFLNAKGVKSDGQCNIKGYGQWRIISAGPWGLEYVGDKWQPQPGFENYPVIRVNWYSARAYCDHYGYRLPTEAEWEYAARGGEDFKYSGSDNIDEVGWYIGNSDNATHAVAAKKANGYGLYDMTGNVFEWCNDWYNGEYYEHGPGVAPQGPESGLYRMLRGGCWDISAYCSRASFRYSDGVGSRGEYYGFRVCRQL